MSFLGHKKQNERWNNVLKILNDEFAGDRSHIKDASLMYDNKNSQVKKLKDATSILASIAVLKDGNDECKITHIDLTNKILHLSYPLESPAILSYSLDTIATRRLFPLNISSLINRNIAKDKTKPKSANENIAEITKFLKNFCTTYNLTVNRAQFDKSNGIFQFDTTQRDNIYNSTRQYITCVLDKSKKFQIGTIHENVGKIAKDFSSLMSFFTLFGFSDIFAKCTCRNYSTKYTRKRGMQNYMCSHLLYSMSMFPYYLIALLSN